MLQTMNGARGPGPEMKRQRNTWLTAAAFAGLGILAAAGVEVGYQPAAYLVALLGAIYAAYGLYHLARFRIALNDEIMPALKNAHSLTPDPPFERWLHLDLADLGTMQPVLPTPRYISDAR
jgi:hypothetical protein